MTLLPRSLFGRNVMLLLTLIAFGQLTSGLLFRVFVQKPRVDQLAIVAVRQIEATAVILRALSMEQQATFIAQLNEDHIDSGPELRIANAVPTIGASVFPDDTLMAQFARQVAIHLHRSEQELHWDSGNHTLWAPLAITDGATNKTLWIGIHGIQADGDLWRLWLSISLCIGLLAVCGAYLIQRRINRPLQHLVLAAQQVGKGETPIRLTEDAPTEIATVSRSFNRMTASLAQLDQERAIMLAGVSHDLRTPLTKLRLGIEILTAQGDAEVIASMNRSAGEMDTIIDQFMNYARVGSNEELAAVDLNELIRHCVAAYAAQGKTLTLELTELPTLSLRPQAMHRLLGNLIENALCYGRPEFKMCATRNATHVQLSVIDHGPGIPAAQLDSMKQAFTRGSATRSGSPGAGLGLAIVERIAQLHGGELTLLPAAGGGLHARVTLPIVSPNAATT